MKVEHGAALIIVVLLSHTEQMYQNKSNLSVFHLLPPSVFSLTLNKFSKTQQEPDHESDRNSVHKNPLNTKLH